jgi:hypothetical protein
MEPMISLRLVCVVLAALSSGCSEPSPEVSKTNQTFQQEVEAALAETRTEGASDTQIAILESAMESQEILVEDLRTAAHATVECLGEHGLEAVFVEDQSNGGVLQPGYHVNSGATTVDPEAEQPLLDTMDACERKEFYWINRLQYSQPSTIALNGAYLQTKAPALTQCLLDNGVDVGPDATIDALIQATSELSEEAGVNCFMEAGHRLLLASRHAAV